MKENNNKTKSFIEEFNGNKIFAIRKVDEEGNAVGDYPIVSFGMSKARAIVNHVEDIKEFVVNNTK